MFKFTGNKEKVGSPAFTWHFEIQGTLLRVMWHKQLRGSRGKEPVSVDSLFLNFNMANFTWLHQMTDVLPQISNTFMHVIYYWCIFQAVTHQEFFSKKFFPPPQKYTHLNFWLVKITWFYLTNKRLKRGNALVTGNTPFIKLHF